ncbi:hypothetical protein KY290_019361 [Solanum tuberosum]|uniref:Uncharacterized protein n=1 Tax=Solanum tuberosum TaxID=4113 RepID=A0ABQ7VHJ8_SOLTU|nr:hypothetical protein KY284_018313 [Solanum tuberosum]KAH0704039.1 hypothetical protein KY285_018317 [Solanum tuberosum]KAH0763288.1 hypothetical protein KY290_019361 [Solanum tuberosum]
MAGHGTILHYFDGLRDLENGVDLGYTFAIIPSAQTLRKIENKVECQALFLLDVFVLRQHYTECMSAGG